MIASASCLRQREGVLTQEVSGTIVLFDMETSHYYSLDEVGTRIWELCDGVRRVADISTILADEYDAPLTEIGEDVLTLLQDLHDERLVVEVQPSA